MAGPLEAAGRGEKAARIYEDKLSGVLEDWLFSQKQREYNTHISEVEAAIIRVKTLDPSDPSRAVKVLERARNASEWFSTLPSTKKRDIVKMVIRNATWKDDELTVEYRNPFDMIAHTNHSYRKEKVAGLSSDDLFRIWYPVVDAFGTSQKVLGEAIPFGVDSVANGE